MVRKIHPFNINAHSGRLDVSGTPLHIADPHVERLVSLIRANLDSTPLMKHLWYLTSLCNVLKKFIGTTAESGHINRSSKNIWSLLKHQREMQRWRSVRSHHTYHAKPCLTIIQVHCSNTFQHRSHSLKHMNRISSDENLIQQPCHDRRRQEQHIQIIHLTIFCEVSILPPMEVTRRVWKTALT
jgi:hypothetical protein